MGVWAEEEETDTDIEEGNRWRYREDRERERETDGEGRGLLALLLSPEPGGPCVTHALLACTAQGVLGPWDPSGPSWV